MSLSTQPMQAASDPLQRFRQGASEDLLSLAVLHSKELERGLVQQLLEASFPAGMSIALGSDAGKEAVRLTRQGLVDLPGELDLDTMQILATEYADIYLNYNFRASPCESVWLDEDHLTMQEPMFRIRKVYERHGLAAQDWRQRPDDHLVHQLQFLSHLMGPQAPEDHLREAARFMDEHILLWIDDFSERVAQRAATRFYAGLALLTAAYLDELRDLLAQVLDEPRPSAAETQEPQQSSDAVAVQPPAPYVPGSAPSW